MTEIVLITGGSRGIGLATAHAIAGNAEAGTVLVLVARSGFDFDGAVGDLRRIYPKVRIEAITVDLSDIDSITHIYNKLDQWNVRLSTIVNNAGFTKPASVKGIEIRDFERSMRVNVYAPFRIVQEAVLRNHPLKRIVNIASTAGIEGRPGWLTYSASKSAMITMSEVLRDELRPFGTEVICLSPGRCATQLRKILAPDEDQTSIMQPSHVANIIALMLTETGSLLLSQNLIVRK